jgi:hypothetical protein
VLIAARPTSQLLNRFVDLRRDIFGLVEKQVSLTQVSLVRS